MIKYKTENGLWSYNKKYIKPVVCERETESSIWIDGNRCSKHTEYHSYFDTFEQAKDHLNIIAYRKVCGLKYSLEQAEKTMKEIEGLKEEDDI